MPTCVDCGLYGNLVELRSHICNTQALSTTTKENLMTEAPSNPPADWAISQAIKIMDEDYSLASVKNLMYRNMPAMNRILNVARFIEQNIQEPEDPIIAIAREVATPWVGIHSDLNVDDTAFARVAVLAIQRWIAYSEEESEE